MARDLIKPLIALDAPLKLTVATPPHVHCGRTTPGFMLAHILALVPAMALGIYRFGLPAASVLALSGAAAVAAEAACQKVMEREVTADDYSALYTGLVFACLLPAGAPWWLVLTGSVVTIVLGRMVFGGLGGNPICPAALGWAVCRVSWPEAMNIDQVLLNSDLFYPLSQLKFFGPAGVERFALADLLLGRQLGGIGASQVLGVLLGGAFLMARGYLRPFIPLGFLAGAAGAAAAFNLLAPGLTADPLFHLATGATCFAAFFLATDCSSSPVGAWPMLLYGAMGGALTVVIRVYGVYPDGVVFAVVLANIANPLFDRIKPRPFTPPPPRPIIPVMPTGRARGGR